MLDSASAGVPVRASCMTQEGIMVKRVIILVIGCGLAALAEYGRRRRARQRLHSDARQLQRWEDEGGQLAQPSAGSASVPRS